ncbi:MAG: Serine hydroxymethyltransferase [Candidatus Pacebacteria bacterium GW2011_GWB1_47_8]|nr:MAG: Serine hydroxymethyltransferase [Candidatus Pacebacteria bacterium GW2011_GWA1_46_10]KKU84714.1 MAG: Serine hydroxymethyltransferase [Candidatus Pacebacteria bacterium GW2011_GWB1_47_8]HCR81026.1 serine hydroxymethyltransferase [Candidatus Paceibacterota bacterium]
MKKNIIFELVKKEEARQRQMIGLIPSENHISPEVSAVLSSSLSSKYAEGYPGRRYYEGNQIIDEIENLAKERIKKLFGVPHANVQPYSGSPANSAVQFALLELGDTMMGLALASGGHLTHGHPKVTFSGRYFRSVQYGLDDRARIDFDQVRELALKHQPKLMIIGNTAYPFLMDFKKFREIAEEVGAYVLADISHVTGLVIAGEHPNPVPYVDVVMSTTHKTFRGPRGAMILVTAAGLKRDPELSDKIDKAVFPALQGGPHNATTAGIAIAAAEAMTPAFKRYGKQIRRNADALAAALQKQGLKLVGDGTETHLMLIDLTNYGQGFGLQVAFAMDVAGIYANRNTIPHEPMSPFYPSGVRLGTPMVTTRGMKEKEMRQIAAWIARVVEIVKDEQLPADKKLRQQFIRDFRAKASKNKQLLAIRKEVEKMASKFPLFTWK